MFLKRFNNQWQKSSPKCQNSIESNSLLREIEVKVEAVTSLKSIMALAISFPKKRNFILILAMCAGLVVLPKGTANSPLVLNMYLVPSWLPVEAKTQVWSEKVIVKHHTLYLHSLRSFYYE